MSKPKLALVRPSSRKPPRPAAASAHRLEQGDARLVVQLPAEVHQAIKQKAVSCRMTIREYILSLLREDGVVD